MDPLLGVGQSARDKGRGLNEEHCWVWGGGVALNQKLGRWVPRPFVFCLL